MDTFFSDKSDIFYRCVEDSNEAIMLTDRSGKILYVNPAWVDIYGYTQEEALQSTPRILHSGNQNSNFYEKMWKEIQNVGYWKGELLNSSKKGKLIPVLLSITPYKENGEIKGYMGIALDISWKKEIEEKMIRQDRLSSLGFLVGGVAHQIGTPLSIVRGRAELIQKSLTKDENKQVTKNIFSIIDQIDKITEFVKSLLLFGRENQQAGLKSVNLSLVLKECLNLLNDPIQEMNVQIKNQISPELFVLGDFQKIQQILVNLMINSLHSIEDTTKLNGKKDYFIQLSTQIFSEENRVILSVRDNGIGIKPEILNNLFQPFFTTKEVGRGTGLGLSICLKFMQEMKGDIRVVNNEEGAEFQLVFQK